MEKKEREQLKERFMNLVVDDKREKITVKDLTATAMMIRSTPPDYSVLLNFIEKELDKAREEGRREGSEITSRYISDFVISESGKSGRKEILEYIDKLSKYQFTRSKHLKREGVKRRNICQGILDRSRRWKKV